MIRDDEPDRGFGLEWCRCIRANALSKARRLRTETIAAKRTDQRDLSRGGSEQAAVCSDQLDVERLSQHKVKRIKQRDPQLQGPPLRAFSKTHRRRRLGVLRRVDLLRTACLVADLMDVLAGGVRSDAWLTVPGGEHMLGFLAPARLLLGRYRRVCAGSEASGPVAAQRMLDRHAFSIGRVPDR